MFYLTQTCNRGDSCDYGHDYDLTEEHLKQMRVAAKKTPCPGANRGGFEWRTSILDHTPDDVFLLPRTPPLGLVCPHGEGCIWAHKCAFATKCHFYKEGKCKFVGRECCICCCFLLVLALLRLAARHGMLLMEGETC